MIQYSLSQFNTLIKDHFKQMDPSYWIVAEIGELRVHQNGHCYLDLIEKSGSRIIAKSRATIWSYSFTTISKTFYASTGMKLAVGMKVLVNASIQFHELYGLSLNVNDIDPNFTVGEREKRKKEVIDKLVGEGLFDQNGTLPLSLVPQRVAIISSSSAAGYGDFVHQLKNNEYTYRVHTTLFDATMQGAGASESIISKLDEIGNSNKTYDLVVIIRGGGAQTDFDCFDDYNLCKTIALMKFPIITGIGHERDNTIADMVAHTTLKTPTAVAEFILAGFINYESSVNQKFEKIAAKTQSLLHSNSEFISTMTHRLALVAQKSIYTQELNLNHFQKLIKDRSYQLISRQKEHLNLLEQQATSYDPKVILKRGYTITTVNGHNVSRKPVSPGDIIETTTKDSIIKSQVQ